MRVQAERHLQLINRCCSNPDREDAVQPPQTPVQAFEPVD
jgi:hypothetical protein